MRLIGTFNFLLFAISCHLATSFLQQTSFLSTTTIKNARISQYNSNIPQLQMRPESSYHKSEQKLTIPSKEQLLIATTTLATVSMPLAAHAADGGAVAIALVIGPILDTFIFVMNLLFVCRTVMTWYPKTDIKVFPFNAIYWPTEPLLAPAREIIPPAFGVDVSTIVWISTLSFLHEVLTGQQGILTLLEKS